MSAAYHGVLEGVTLERGGYLELPPLALGSVPGVGLVVAASLAALRAGRWVGPREGVLHERIRKVWYRRKRPGYAAERWFHDVRGTAVSTADGQVSFAPAGRIARVCVRPPGEFICGG